MSNFSSYLALAYGDFPILQKPHASSQSHKLSSSREYESSSACYLWHDDFLKLFSFELSLESDILGLVIAMLLFYCLQK